MSILSFGFSYLQAKRMKKRQRVEVEVGKTGKNNCREREEKQRRRLT